MWTTAYPPAPPHVGCSQVRRPQQQANPPLPAHLPQLRQLACSTRCPLLVPLRTRLQRLQPAALLLELRQQGAAATAAAAQTPCLLLHQQGLDCLQLSSGCLQRRLGAVPGPLQLGGLRPQALCFSSKLAAALPCLRQLRRQLSALLMCCPAAAGGSCIKLARQAGPQRGQLSVLLLPALQGPWDGQAALSWKVRHAGMDTA